MKSDGADRVLALSLRPKCLADLVGQRKVVDGLTAQFQSGRIPHFYIIEGPVGAGKTTLGRILALLLQLQTTPFRDLQPSDWQHYRKYDIVEINAANKTGVDDMRQLVQDMRFLPMPPSKAKVRILDEAHQLSNAAQNTLNTETEDVQPHVFFIFMTSAGNKIIPALRRRAFIISPSSLDAEGISSLVRLAKEKSNHEGAVDDLLQHLRASGVTTPGLVMQAAEMFFCGLSEAGKDSKQKVDALAICRLVAGGDWVGCAARLQDVQKADAYSLRLAVAGYLKALLLKAAGNRAVALSRAVEKVTGPCGEDVLPALCAALCLACHEMTPPKRRE